MIPGPIEQIVNGKNGVYDMIYLQRESRSLSRYEKLVELFDKNYDSDKLMEMEKKVNENFFYLINFFYFIYSLKFYI